MARSSRWRDQSSGCAIDDGVGDRRGNAEPPRGGEHRVALLAGDQLGVEIARAARRGGRARERRRRGRGERGRRGRRRDAADGQRVPAVPASRRPRSACQCPTAPVNPRDRPAERRPSPLVRRQRDGLLLIGDQVRAEDRAHAGGVAGALELDRAIDAVGVGAGERPVPPLGGGGGESSRGWRRRCRRRSGCGRAGAPRAAALVSGFVRYLKPECTPGTGTRQATDPSGPRNSRREGNFGPQVDRRPLPA